MAAPRPVPTALKILRGNPGKRGLPQEPPAVKRAVRMPKWLSNDARVHWKSLLPIVTETRVMTAADEHALAIGCEALAEYQACLATVAEHGRTYTLLTRSGDEMVRARPEVAMASDAWRRYKSMLIEFGLTPAARTKVAAVGGAAQERDEWDDL